MDDPPAQKPVLNNPVAVGGPQGSLRARMMIWVLAPLLIAGIGLLMTAYEEARRSANLAYDRVLLGSALAIADRVIVDNGVLEVDLPYVALEMLTSSGQDRVFYRVLDHERRVITGYSDLPDAPGEVPQSEGQRFYDATYRRELVRIISLYRAVNDAEMRGIYEVQVAETITERLTLTNALLFAAASRQLILIILAAAICWVGVSLGLRPLRRLVAAIGRRSDRDLRPIDHPVPKEVYPLVQALNTLLGRLDSSLAELRQVLGDAAHQIRTPLASLQTRAEVALRETDPQRREESLKALLATTKRTSRLANQLLSLARSSPEASAHRPRERVDIRALAAGFVSDTVPRALRVNKDLGLDDRWQAPDGAAPVIMGDRVMIEEMLVNLVDNALIYCPAGAQVTVVISARYLNDTHWVVLKVLDSGPGVPEDAKERVFERFFRADPGASAGAGLGLAIVAEIARQHLGQVRVIEGINGKGFGVEILLPGVR